MVKDKIVFTSAYSYLAKTQFYAVVPHITKFDNIFLDVKDLVSYKLNNKNLDKNEILKLFDDYEEIEEFNFNAKRRWTLYKNYRHYKKSIFKCLNHINPLAIVSCSDMALSDRILSLWCKKRKKKFIILQPSFIKNVFSKKEVFLKRLKHNIINRLTGIPLHRKQHLFGNENEWTYLLLWSEHFIENPKRKNMFFVGNPAFDFLFEQFSPKKVIKNNIIICTQEIDVLVGKELSNLVIEIYKKAIKLKPNLNFIIKVHPRENIEKYEILLNESKFPNVKIVKENNLYELFKISDIQISANSFTSLEAAAMGIPIIIVNPDNKLQFFDHFREEINIKVTDVKNIGNAIDKALSKKYWQEFLVKREIYFKKMFGSTDGQSSKLTANKIIEIVKK